MSDKTESNNKLTTVKTVYARAALLLLAINFCLTTYVVVNLNDSVQMQVDQATGQPTEGPEKAPRAKSAPQDTTPSTTQEVSTRPSE